MMPLSIRNIGHTHHVDWRNTRCSEINVVVAGPCIKHETPVVVSLRDNTGKIT
jgi:hypothetical protein